MNKIWGFFFVLMVMLSSCSVKKNVQSVSSVPVITNPYSADELINDSLFNTAHIGIALMDADKNQYLYQYQSNKYFIPASNMKIMTCYAAMKYLGDSLEGLRYEVDSTEGLIIKGTGDPSFLHPKFKQQKIYEFLKNHKPFLYLYNRNTYRFKPFGKGWTLDDYYEDYMNERSEFPIYGNDRNTFKRADSSIQFYNYAHDERKEYNGGFGLRSPIMIVPSTMDELNNGIPYFIRLINDTLGKQYMDVLYKFDFNKPSHVLYSQPTDSVLQYMMYNSDNFFAEQLLLMVSYKQLEQMNDTRMFDTLMATDYKDFPQKPRWADACGLSRYNLFTPEDIVYVLGKTKKDFAADRINAIYPAGNQGTLKGFYMNNSDAIHAKTGSMNGVFCISGYLTTKQHKHITFSVMVNNHQAKAELVRRKIESYLSKIIEQN